MLHQELLPVGVLIVVQVCGKQSLKNGRFDECEHGRRIRLWRIKDKPQVVLGEKKETFLFSPDSDRAIKNQNVPLMFSREFRR